MAGLILLLLLALPPRLARAAEDASVPVRQVVLDIISFTRWPEPHVPLRLCVVGQPLFADAFFAGDARAGGAPLLATRMRYGDSQLGPACDVVYEGALAQPERAELLRALAGHPVLTVGEAGGEAGASCIEATMFCLQVSGLQVSFASNIDAIARSGVRLNPRVLLLRRRPAPGVNQ